MSQRLTAESTVDEARDYVLYFKYLSFDEDFGAAAEQLLMEAGIVLDSLCETDSVPEQLMTRLMEQFGSEYD